MIGELRNIQAVIEAEETQVEAARKRVSEKIRVEKGIRPPKYQEELG